MSEQLWQRDKGIMDAWPQDITIPFEMLMTFRHSFLSLNYLHWWCKAWHWTELLHCSWKTFHLKATFIFFTFQWAASSGLTIGPVLKLGYFRLNALRRAKQKHYIWRRHITAWSLVRDDCIADGCKQQFSEARKTDGDLERGFQPCKQILA